LVFAFFVACSLVQNLGFTVSPLCEFSFSTTCAKNYLF
jgi:hypothetical protein